MTTPTPVRTMDIHMSICDLVDCNGNYSQVQLNLHTLPFDAEPNKQSPASKIANMFMDFMQTEEFIEACQKYNVSCFIKKV